MCVCGCFNPNPNVTTRLLVMCVCGCLIASPTFCICSVAHSMRPPVGMQQSRYLGAVKSIQSIVRLCKDLQFYLISVLASCAAEFVAKT